MDFRRRAKRARRFQEKGPARGFAESPQCAVRRGLGRGRKALGLSDRRRRGVSIPRKAIGVANPSQCLANIDFAQRVGTDRSGFPVPPITIRDPRNLLVRAVGGGDETIFRESTT